MHFNTLEYLIAIDDEGSMSRAAQKLFVSQPALSKCVKKLEQQFGCELFVRDAQGLHTTAAGKLLVDYARNALKNARKLEQDLMLQSGKITIGMSSTFIHFLTFYVLPEMMARYPGMEIYTSLSQPDNPGKQLLDRTLDLAISVVQHGQPVESTQGISSCILRTDRTLIGVSEHSELVCRGVDIGEKYPYLDPKYLEGHAMIMPENSQFYQTVREFLALHNVSYSVALCTSNAQSRKFLCTVGTDVAFLPASFVETDVLTSKPVYFQTDDTLPLWDVILYWRSSGESNVMLKDFIKSIRRAFAN